MRQILWVFPTHGENDRRLRPPSRVSSPVRFSLTHGMNTAETKSGTTAGFSSSIMSDWGSAKKTGDAGFRRRVRKVFPCSGHSSCPRSLGVQEYAHERNSGSVIKEWLKLVRLYWPECPAVVSADGRLIELGHHAAITHAGGKGF